jgi:hypothetical protein
MLNASSIRVYSSSSNMVLSKDTHAIIPKSLVSGFNKAEVFLNKPITELGQYIRS